MHKNRLRYLLEKKDQQSLDPVERQELDDWFEQLNFEPGMTALSTEDEQRHFDELQARLGTRQSRRRLGYKIVAAASLLLAGAAALFFYGQSSVQDARLPVVVQKNTTIRPGSDQAVLELAQGQEVALNHKAGGALRTAGGVTIVKPEPGHVSYLQAASLATTETNAIRTPRGGQYRVTLSDGTEVWLNAASSLRFPVSFNQQHVRKVVLTGQAYFEVAKSAGKPFVVEVASARHPNRLMEVEVLGTHFDIMAYDDEDAFHTTLLEGSVRVKAAGSAKVIRPGQQVLVNETMHVGAADTETAVAWKNGLTVFREARIESIMRQISRWYNVDIVYNGKVGDRLFTGEIARSSGLPQVLRVLELSNIKFEVRGTTIFVKPQ